MRRLALFSALSAKLKDKRIKVISGFEKMKPRTKEMVQILENFKLKAGQDKVSLIIPENLENISRSGRNIQNFNLLQAKQLNTYKIINNKWLLLAKPSIKVIEETFLTKKKKLKKT